MESNNRQTALNLLIARAEQQGYLTFDAIMDCTDQLALPLQDFDWIVNGLATRGVIVYDDVPIAAQGEDKEQDDYDDFAQSDYDAIFDEAIALAPDLKAFINVVRSIKPPQANEVAQLKYHVQEGNAHARTRLLEMYLRVVVRIALQRAKTYDIIEELPDIIGDGYEGLLMAVDKYSIEEPMPFTSYASFWIFQNITRNQVLKNKHIYCPAHAKEGYFKAYQQLKQQGYTMCEGLLNCDEAKQIVVDELQCSQEEAQRMLFLGCEQASFDEFVDKLLEDESVCDWNTPACMMQKSEDEEREFWGLELEELKAAVATVLDRLTEREKLIIEQRYGLQDNVSRTLEEVGKTLGVTRERVRQIEAKALRKLRHPSKKRILKSYVEYDSGWKTPAVLETSSSRDKWRYFIELKHTPQPTEKSTIKEALSPTQVEEAITVEKTVLEQAPERIAVTANDEVLENSSDTDSVASIPLDKTKVEIAGEKEYYSELFFYCQAGVCAVLALKKDKTVLLLQGSRIAIQKAQECNYLVQKMRKKEQSSIGVNGLLRNNVGFNVLTKATSFCIFSNADARNVANQWVTGNGNAICELMGRMDSINETDLITESEVIRKASALDMDICQSKLFANQEAERKRQEEFARQEAERKRQEELARQEAERKRQEELARQEAERKRQEELARQEAERKRQEELARQEAERKRQEELARQEAERKRQEELARQETEHERQEEFARQEAERKRQEELARQEAERKRQEEVARQEAERKRQEELTRQEAVRKRQEELVRQEAERQCYRRENRCQHCGGAFKKRLLGLLGIVCSQCGRKKDY